MRRLEADGGEVHDLYEEVAFPAAPPGRPHVYLDMIVSVDGSVSVDGRAGPLAGPADRVAFRRLRDAADAILVGAETVRVERYGPPRTSPEAVAAREQRGQRPHPTIAVVSASLRLDARARLFSDPDRRAVIVTTEDADRSATERLAVVADVIRAGRGLVDLPAALRILRERGTQLLLCEGGPTLNAQLVGLDLVDEIFVTVAPVLVGGRGPRLLAGELAGGARRLRLVEGREHEGELLLRYAVRDAREATGRAVRSGRGSEEGSQ